MCAHAFNRRNSGSYQTRRWREPDSNHRYRSYERVFRLLPNRHLDELLAAGRDVYSELKNLCVWVKDNGGMGSLYRSQHELVFVFKHGRHGHRNNVQLGQFGRNRSNVWRYPGVNSFARSTTEGNLLALHPTVKPVAMVADAILGCTARGDIGGAFVTHAP